jgi:hypothetical protein
LAQGVKDLVVFNPYTKQVLHFDTNGKREYQAPVTLSLQCGCDVTV